MWSKTAKAEKLKRKILEIEIRNLKTLSFQYFLTFSIFVCKVGDGNPLRRWRVCLEVSASPSEVLQRLLKERLLWQTELQQEKVLETLDKQTDVYHYTCCNMAPQPCYDYVVLRYD